MSNMFDYLAWRDDLSLEQDPLNEVDGMILTRFSYMPFELIAERIASGEISVAEASSLLSAEPDLEKRVLLRDDVKLLECLSESHRFGSMMLIDYEKQTEPESQTQFCAITLRMTDGRHFVLYRGTDDTLVGWKEDLNMAFISPVPAQTLSVRYLNRIANQVPGELLVGGHSKGGNLAVYASSFCLPQVQNRISRIYNFDGPGFADSVLESPGYLAACGCIRTYVPQSSVVGMLLGHEEEHTIVHSSHIINLLQHSVYTWDVEQNHFIYLPEITDGSKLIDATVKSWLAASDYAQREKFVDAVFAVLSETNELNFRDMAENWFSSTVAIAKAIRNLDEDTRKVVFETISTLMRCTKEELTGAIKGKNPPDSQSNS